jgi:hypothetical protein
MAGDPVVNIDDERDQAAAQLLMFLRSLDADQLELYRRTHPESASVVASMREEREIREFLWPSLLDRLGEDQAHFCWLNMVAVDDHQSALRMGLSISEVFAGALEITQRQFDAEGLGR